MASLCFKRILLTQSDTDMTEQFYVAVKGSLHASDSSVFGLTSEEVNALTKRYPDSNKEVINGLLIKASPLKVINSLGELGYRVVCSSGEAEIVWTLRREVLDEKSPISSKEFKRRNNNIHETVTVIVEEGKYTITKESNFNSAFHEDKEMQVEQKEDFLIKNDQNENVNFKGHKGPGRKEIEKIGAKPEDFAQYSHYKGPKIVIKNPSEERVEQGGVIINTNEESPENSFAYRSFYTQKYSNQPTHHSSPIPHSMPPKRHDCLHNSSNPTVHQTLDEMDFERGIWMPAMNGDLSQLRVHLNKGTHPDIEDQAGYTALHYAARCGHPQICTQLIRAGASINKPTRAGQATPLHRAAFAGHHDICCILLHYGADIQAKDVDGRTPLHRAVEGEHKEIIEEFLQICPAAAFDKDNQGKSPLTYAEEKGSLSLLFMGVIN